MMSRINRVEKIVVPIPSKVARLIQDFPVKCISRLHTYIQHFEPNLASKNPIIEFYRNTLIFTDTSNTGFNCTISDLTDVVNAWIQHSYLNDAHKQGCDSVMHLYDRLRFTYTYSVRCYNNLDEWFMMLDILSNVLDVPIAVIEEALNVELDPSYTAPSKFLAQFDRLDLWYVIKWINKLSGIKML